MAPNDPQSPLPIDKITSRLKKLAALQGFVTPDQIEERDRVEGILDRENITINALAGERREAAVPHRPRRLISVRRIPRYADPTWVYLNSVGRVPLLSKNQEVVLPRGTSVEMVLDRDLYYTPEELRH